MTIGEINRLSVVEKVRAKQITQTEGASQLGLTKRQMIRICKNFENYGAKGLISKRRGKPSNNSLPNKLKEQAIWLVKNNYFDFGPTFAHQKLNEEHGLKLSVESLRKLMIESGIWKGRKRKPAKYHPMRQRRSALGELIQIDGSVHDWFEGRGEKCCLLVFIDDATGRLMKLLFVPAETTEAYFQASKSYLMQYGRPVGFYSDKHSIFKVNIREANTGTGETQFSRAMRELGINLICANSPQAKGRVEKANRTLQDRLVKEMRLNNINNINAANDFLPLFVSDYNKRFAIEATSQIDAHRKTLPEPEILDLLMSKQAVRKLSKNLELSYQNVLYQLQIKTPSYSMRGAHITVCDQGGKVTLLYKGRAIDYKTLNKKHRETPVSTAKEIESFKLGLQSNSPSKDHPWNKYLSLFVKKGAVAKGDISILDKR